MKLEANRIVTTDSSESQIIRKHLENIFLKKARKHIKMDEFLSSHVLLKFNPGDINNLYRFVTVNEIETVINSLHKQKPRTTQIYC